jgi:hypothetical protein
VAWDRVSRDDVLRAIEEYDRLGYNHRRYASKAILGVTYEFVTGQPVGSRDFESGKSGAAAVLRKLGFEVQDTRYPTGEG